MFAPQFDIIWDVMPDMMHVCQGVIEAHFVDLLKGNRRPAAPQLWKKRKGMDADEWREKKKENEKMVQQNNYVTVKVRGWELSKAKKDLVDRRAVALGGEKQWIRSNLAVFRRTGSLNAHDWLKIMESAEMYLFEGILNKKRHWTTWRALVDSVRALLAATADGDGDDDEQAESIASKIRALKYKVIKALCLFERDFPPTDLSHHHHILSHFPDAIALWNAVRGFWSFFGERYTNI